MCHGKIVYFLISNLKLSDNLKSNGDDFSLGLGDTAGICDEKQRSNSVLLSIAMSNTGAYNTKP